MTLIEEVQKVDKSIIFINIVYDNGIKCYIQKFKEKGYHIVGKDTNPIVRSLIFEYIKKFDKKYEEYICLDTFYLDKLSQGDKIYKLNDYCCKLCYE